MIIEKAKDKLEIQCYQNDLTCLISTHKQVANKISSFDYVLNKILLRKPENLHFYDEEDACMHFDEVVCDNAWDGNEALSDILVNCYINGVLYKPVYLQSEFDRGECCIKMEVVSG